MRQGALPDDSPYDLSMDALRRVTDVFFNRLAGHFPFINEHILHGHVRSGQCSSFLINSVVAVTLRFCPFEVFSGGVETVNESPWRNGAYFLKRAKEQLMSLLAIPTTDVVSGILILAWAEFGDNNEAGLWMLSGMAIRMAQDMGLHRTPEQENNPTVAFWDRSPLSPDGKGLLSDEMSKIHQAKSKLLLFWAVFALDVSVSLLTGRPPTPKRSEVDVPIPTAQDLKATQLDFTESVSMKNMIFPEVARFMLSFSEAVELLNQTWPEDHDGGGGSRESTKRARLSKVRDNIMNQYHSLSSELTFTIENYKRAATDKQAGLFLMLHVYFYAFTILLSQAEMRDETLHSSADAYGGIQQPQAALLACQKIVQILNTAELIDDTGYLSTPFINQGLFIAASTILEEQHLKQASSVDRPNNFLSLVSSSDVDYLCRKLKEMSHFFKGVGGTLAAIERKKREMLLKINQDNHANEDEESDDEKNEVVQLSDGGIVNRYSIPEGRS
ncbi:C6 transcription factor [Colletotrichum karsti]|uniref:C6 transcription factor n=1 Tax=Colletotrichum karsti TaxID=1095194 RepID=A0A9P6IG81_9PEZI|nr:C6 transcription factor [Colletotrichum karsti]KAF9881456.1 C6 transcription factor [Colletotrichum karsti]